MKKYHEHEYDLYIITAKTGNKPLWSWQEWKHVSKVLEPIIVKENKVGISVSQLDLTTEGGAKDIKFGKLSWKEESFAKWNHSSPITANFSSGWLFSNIELWSPNWNICSKEQIPPDFFLSMTNEQAFYVKKESLNVDTTIIIAAKKNLSHEYLAIVRRQVTELGKLIKASLVITRVKSWGEGSSDGDELTFSNSIQDMTHSRSWTKEERTPGFWKNNIPTMDILKERKQWEDLLK